MINPLRFIATAADKREVYELLGGYKTIFSQADQELWNLSRQALLSQEVQKILIHEKPEDILTELAKINDGKVFLSDLNRIYTAHMDTSFCKNFGSCC
jgi:hypothetical protein